MEVGHLSRKPDRGLFADDDAWNERLAGQEAGRSLVLAGHMLEARGMAPWRLERRSLGVVAGTASETIVGLAREGELGTQLVGKRRVSKEKNSFTAARPTWWCTRLRTAVSGAAEGCLLFRTARFHGWKALSRRSEGRFGEGRHGGGWGTRM